MKEGNYWFEINSPETTIKFEDLVLSTKYYVGDIFSTSGTLVAVLPFQYSGGGGLAQDILEL